MIKNVVVYSSAKTSNCVWCDRIIKLLQDHTEAESTIITEIKLDSKEKVKEMQKAVGQKVNTVPQVIIDGVYIGGFTETERYINKGRNK